MFRLVISATGLNSAYTFISGPNYVSLKIVPPAVEALWGPCEAASSSPATEAACLQRKRGADSVHFCQGDDVAMFWLSHQELAVERNVNVREELLQRWVSVTEQQPEGFRRICLWKCLWGKLCFTCTKRCILTLRMEFHFVNWDMGSENYNNYKLCFLLLILNSIENCVSKIIC
jgi:hypothetical protein